MDRLRRMSHLATALAVLAIGLRILLPALHSHPTHGGGHGYHDPAAAVTCSCGHVHSVAATGDAGAADSREGAEATPAACHGCLACELEQGTPVHLPTDADWQLIEFARHDPPARAGETRHDRYPHALARPRAPPRHQA